MTFQSPEYVQVQILGQEVRWFIIYTLDRKEKRGMHDAKTSRECFDQLTANLALLHGPYRIEAGREKENEGGHVTDRRRPFVWNMMGTGASTEISGVVHPVFAHSSDRPAPAAPSVDVALHVKLREMELRLEHDAAMREAQDRFDDEMAEDDDEDGEELEPKGLGIDKETIEAVRDLFREFRGFTVPAARSTAEVPITGTSSAAPASGPISSDSELIAAMDEMARQHPDSAKQYRDQILKEYGRKEQP